jgi:hypothetical protein
MSDRDPADPKRRRLDGVIPELLKRAVELGVEKATEAPDSLKALVGDMKVPKEIAHLLLTQMEDTKNGLFRVVAKEMRDFLEHTNVAGEMTKMLTTVQFEINTTIRFTPNDGNSSAAENSADDDGTKTSGEKTRDTIPPPSMPKPEVKTEVQVTTREPRPRRRSRE